MKLSPNVPSEILNSVNIKKIDSKKVFTTITLTGTEFVIDDNRWYLSSTYDVELAVNSKDDLNIISAELVDYFISGVPKSEEREFLPYLKKYAFPKSDERLKLLVKFLALE